jgi:hypothetical protein
MESIQPQTGTQRLIDVQAAFEVGGWLWEKKKKKKKLGMHTTEMYYYVT